MVRALGGWGGENFWELWWGRGRGVGVRGGGEKKKEKDGEKRGFFF